MREIECIDEIKLTDKEVKRSSEVANEYVKYKFKRGKLESIRPATEEIRLEISKLVQEYKKTVEEIYNKYKIM